MGGVWGRKPNLSCQHLVGHVELECERTLGNLFCFFLLWFFAADHALPDPTAHVAGLSQELQHSEIRSNRIEIVYNPLHIEYT